MHRSLFIDRPIAIEILAKTRAGTGGDGGEEEASSGGRDQVPAAPGDVCVRSCLRARAILVSHSREDRRELEKQTVIECPRGD